MRLAVPLFVAALAMAPARALGQAEAMPAYPGTSGAPLYVSQILPAPPKGDYVHDGLYFRYAVGPTYLRVTGDGPAGSIATGGVGIGEVLAIGGTPAPGLVIAGAAVAHLAVDGSQAVVNLGEYGLLADWFPDPGGGWHVGGSIGLGSLDYARNDDDTRGYSVGGTVFGGYDVWVAPQWSVGALLAATLSPRVGMQDAGPLDPLELMLASIAIEATVLCH